MRQVLISNDKLTFVNQTEEEIIEVSVPWHFFKVSLTKMTANSGSNKVYNNILSFLFSFLLSKLGGIWVAVAAFIKSYFVSAASTKIPEDDPYKIGADETEFSASLDYLTKSFLLTHAPEFGDPLIVIVTEPTLCTLKPFSESESGTLYFYKNIDPESLSGKALFNLLSQQEGLIFFLEGIRGHSIIERQEISIDQLHQDQ